MAEEENITQELHGHLTQMLRTTLSGGLQMTEQRARRHQNEAEAERRIAAEAARQLEERKRAEREANALLAQQSITRQGEERASEARKAVDPEVGLPSPEPEEQITGSCERAEMGSSALDLDMDTGTELDLDMDMDMDMTRSFSTTDLGR
jgi:hypothetical protein